MAALPRHPHRNHTQSDLDQASRKVISIEVQAYQIVVSSVEKGTAEKVKAGDGGRSTSSTLDRSCRGWDAGTPQLADGMLCGMLYKPVTRLIQPPLVPGISRPRR